ncbi:MAG: hypothetical protein Kow00124_30440 [Anaerolineae bacterium]
MSDQPVGKAYRHEFMPQRRSLRRLFRAVWGLSVLMTIVVGVGAGILLYGRSTRLGVQNDDLLAFALALAVLYFLARSLLSAAATFVASADIEVDNEGVLLYVFGRRGRRIPWERIREGAIRRVRLRSTFRPDREGERAHIVLVPGLPPIYALAGAYYRTGFVPVFVVTPDHDRHEALLARLAERAHPADKG